jgi:ATPase subunit of ABC transporter with duplicated ATPase domains
LDFRYKPISSHQLLVVDNLEIGYYYSLLPPMSFMLKSGEKLAVTGFNGIGKTTLLKTLIQGNSLQSRVASNLSTMSRIAYFAQEHTWDNPIN